MPRQKRVIATLVCFVIQYICSIEAWTNESFNMAESAWLQYMSSAFGWSNSTWQPFLTSNWHFWQMVQMSAQCLLCKTEKAQISGQMQIICTGWQLWLATSQRCNVFVLATVFCRFGSLGLAIKRNFCSGFEHKVWSRFWSWSSGKILKLKFMLVLNCPFLTLGAKLSYNLVMTTKIIKAMLSALLSVTPFV